MSVDLVLKVLYVTLLHPFVCGLIPLCLRARTVKWDAPPMLAAFAWAGLVSLGWAAAAANRRLAHGRPRSVDLGEEVIVITGGASGLGMLVAEVYGMRGATVAVLDVRDMDNGEARGVRHYRCDVSDKAQVAKAAAAIERDVSRRRAADGPTGLADACASSGRRRCSSTTRPSSWARRSST